MISYGIIFIQVSCHIQAFSNNEHQNAGSNLASWHCSFLAGRLGALPSLTVFTCSCTTLHLYWPNQLKGMWGSELVHFERKGMGKRGMTERNSPFHPKLIFTDNLWCWQLEYACRDCWWGPCSMCNWLQKSKENTWMGKEWDGKLMSSLWKSFFRSWGETWIKIVGAILVTPSSKWFCRVVGDLR